MTAKREKFSNELDRLISEGELLFYAIRRDCYRENFDKSLLKMLNGNKDEFNEFVAKLPDFSVDYQKWYSEAHSVVKYTLPDRLEDFKSYYEYKKPRKTIDFSNYMIRDYLQGLEIKRNNAEVVVDGSAAIPEFQQQLNIVKAARKTLDSVLIDMKNIIQADLFDSEIDSAKALAKAGYGRAAGAICGVIIEKHLLQVCRTHSITISKKNPGISDINQTLKDKNVTTIPQWRFVQHLADIRNICDHAKGREPTKEEIEDLVIGAEKILKTIF